jgi:TRAP-type C4-dicarboxylate transport system permease small subunit
MKKFCDVLETGTMAFLIFMFCVMVVIGGAQIFTRYVMDYSLYWSEEAMRYIFVWLVFVSMGLGIRHKVHVAIEVLVNKMPSKGKKVLQMIIMLLVLVFCLAFTYYGVKLTGRYISQLSPALRWPMGIVYVALPLGGVLGVCFSLEQLDILRKGEAK